MILGFIIVLPTLLFFVPLPQEEEFSEFWLLGSDHMIENGGFDFSVENSFSIYLGVANDMSGLEFYTVYVKLANLSDPLPNRAKGLPSPLEPIFEYNLFLENGKESEKELVFSFDGVSFEANMCRISRLVINDQNIQIDKMLSWDEQNQGYYCQFVFELWIYDKATSDFQFHNRSVWFWLNLNK